MIRREDWNMIVEQTANGVYQKDIAAKLGVHPKTVSRALKRKSPPKGRKKQVKPRKLDPYIDQVEALLHEGVWNAKVILREIQQKGYTGGYTLVRDYIKPKRTLRPSKATVRFETMPGQQLQHDWGEVVTVVGDQKTKVYFSVNTLGWSRRFFAYGAPRMDAEHTYESLILSMEWFGGVPTQVLVDNQKAAVVENRGRDRIRFNQRFLDLANYYGFKPKACRPRRAQTKGKTERMVGYVKHHFFVRYRRFESFAHLNQLLKMWLVKEADERVHGTLKERVSDRFEQESKVLAALPTVRFDTSYMEHRHVAWDGYVDVRGNRYSVPGEYCGQKVAVRITLDGQIHIHALNGDPIADHCQKPVRKGWSTVPAHHEKLWRQVYDVQRRDLSVYEAVAKWN